MKKNPPDQLYKYFHDDRTDVLENGMIRYTQPREFNDPFEVLPYIKAIADEKAVDKSAEKIWDKQDIFYETLKKSLANHPKIQSLPETEKESITLSAKRKMEQMIPSHLLIAKNLFTHSMNFQGPTKEIMHESIVGAINDAIGILCLTETHENLLMWSHYSNSHKGFVVGFEKKHKYFQNTSKKVRLAGFVKKVRYTEDRPEFMFFHSTKSKEQNLENWVKNFIWVKSIEWKYEDEWRVVNTLRDADSKIDLNGTAIFLFRFPLESIKTIYLGCKMEEDKKKQILSIIKRNETLNHVEVYEASIHEKIYKLNFNKI